MYLGSYTCSCVNGWAGDDCSINEDDCENASCFYGSTCHDGVATFTCECAPGKTGLLCHLNDACVSNPCSHDADCDPNPITGAEICTCPSGYTGPSCKIDIDECSKGM